MSKHRSGIAALMFSAALMCAPMGFAQSDNAKPSSSTQASSDQMDHKGHHGGKHMDKMMDQLNLTDDQKAQVKKLHEDGHDQMKQIKSDSSLSAAQKKDKIKQLHQDQMAKMEALLTPEQKTKWEQMKAEHKEKRGMHKDKNSSVGSDSTSPKQ